MSKTYKKEPKAWITVNGHHIPVFDDNYILADDFDNIEATPNKKAANYKSCNSYKEGGIDDKYASIKDKEEMIEQFEKDTGISVDRNCSDKCDKDSLAMVFDTLDSLKKKGYDVDFKEITTTNDLTSKVIASCSPNGQSLGLNPYYYGKTLQQLEEIRKRSVDSGYHVKGPFCNSIKHEVGHRLFTRKILGEQEKALGTINMSDPDNVKLHRDTFNASRNFIRTGDIDKDLYDNNLAYKKLVDKITNTTNKISSKSEVKNLTFTQYTGFYISSKSRQNIHESMAESFADHDTNNNKASFVSNILYDDILRKAW